MSEFAKYEKMREQGTGPEALYREAEADGLDAIARIRLLRTVCGLSPADAKRVSGGSAVWDQEQEIREGATVHWEGSDTVDGHYLMEAKVARVDGNRVRLTGHRRYLIDKDGLVEVPISGGLEFIPIDFFSKTLAERVGEALRFWDNKTRVFKHAG